jgi:hypothetical protein
MVSILSGTSIRAEYNRPRDRSYFPRAPELPFAARHPDRQICSAFGERCWQNATSWLPNHERAAIERIHDVARSREGETKLTSAARPHPCMGEDTWSAKIARLIPPALIAPEAGKAGGGGLVH